MSQDESGKPPRSSGVSREDALPEMSLMEHLTELRYRLIVSIVGVVALTVLSWFFADLLYNFLVAPVVRLLPADANRLTYLSLTEPFVLYLKVAALSGVFFGSPLLIYQAWMFVAPGLFSRERRYALPVIGSSIFCFLAGGAFGYFILFPVMANFFLTLGQDFRQMLTVNNLFGFLVRTLFGCALIFEWPIVVFFLARLGLLTAGAMWRNFRYAVLGIFVVAAIVTPTPDMATQTILAVPMLGLYLFGILVARIVEPR